VRAGSTSRLDCRACSLNSKGGRLAIKSGDGANSPVSRRGRVADALA
jgi:hypothetical protein